MGNFLDKQGVTHLWGKAKEAFDAKGAAKAVDDKLADYIPISQKGANNGVATLDGTGKVPTSQLPSYVSDVFEFANKTSFPTTGEANKIYVAKDTNLTYRWSGSAYVEISPSLALGETSETAYAGDKGKALAEKVTSLEGQITDGVVTGVKGDSEGTYRTGQVNITKTNIGLGNVTNDKQVKGLASGTTADHVVVFGADGYTVKDSGKTLGVSVPANAVFTDTNTTYTVAGSKSASNGSAKINLNGSDSNNSSVTIKGEGLITVTSDTDGVISVKTTATNNTGTVTNVAAGAGLKTADGNNITTSGTIKVALKSETKNSAAVGTPSAVSGSKFYPVEMDSAGVLAVSVPWTDNNTTYTALSTTEIDEAIAAG